MKGECCEDCAQKTVPQIDGTRYICTNAECECHVYHDQPRLPKSSTHTEIDSLFKEFEEKVCPLIVEDWNNFVIEAGEIGEMDIEEIVSERVKEFFAPKLTALIPSIEQSVVEAIEAKLPKCQKHEDQLCGGCVGCSNYQEIRTIIKAFKKE